jgi:hypothetical protein
LSDAICPRGVRRVLEQIALPILFSIGDCLHLGVNGDHRIAETIELVFRFALGRLDHHRPANRPRNGRRVKAVIHQTLCHIFDFNACASPLAQVDNAFVRDEAMLALEKNGKVRIEPFSDVISVENRHLARAFQPGGAHHANVHPRDRQNAGAAPGRCRDRTDTIADCRLLIAD